MATPFVATLQTSIFKQFFLLNDSGSAACFVVFAFIDTMLTISVAFPTQQDKTGGY
jgi:hypothetical protein